MLAICLNLRALSRGAVISMTVSLYINDVSRLIRCFLPPSPTWGFALKQQDRYEHCFVFVCVLPSYLTLLSYPCLQPSDAEKSYRRALRATANDVETLELLGRLLDACNKNRDAVKVFTKLKSLIPDDLEVQRQLARALRRGGNVEGSLDVLEKLLDRDGEYLPGLVDYAWLLEKTLRSVIRLINAVMLLTTQSYISCIAYAHITVIRMRLLLMKMRL